MARKKKKKVKRFLSIGERAERFNLALSKADPFGVESIPGGAHDGLFQGFFRGRRNVERADAIERLRNRGRLF